MSNQTMLDQFGQYIVHRVRDDMIAWFDQAIAGERRDIYSAYLHSRTQRLSPECLAFVHDLVPHIVDGTIGVFLQQFDVDQTLRLEMRDASGAYVNLAHLTDGLEAEYGYNEGWAASFSRERKDVLTVEAEQRADRQRIPPDWNREAP